MPKTLIILDSASDISISQESALGVKVLNIPIAIDGVPYRDRTEVDAAKFLKSLADLAYKELPKTSQITVFEYFEAYLEAAGRGCDEIIVVTINSKGSGCFSAAGHAIEMLNAEHPDIAQRLKIHLVDGGSYTLAVGWPIERAVGKLASGESASEVADWLRDLYSNQITLIALTDLKYPRMSGRLNSSAAVVGDALGIKPVLGVYKGENSIEDKCRGEKKLIPTVVSIYQRLAADIGGEYVVAYGDDRALGDELAKALTKVSGRPPELVSQIGPLIALNSGPRMMGMAFKRKAD